MGIHLGVWLTSFGKEQFMFRYVGIVSVSALLLVLASGQPTAESACCYFSAKNADILQPAQKAFITWDPVEKVESFTVQPKFEGNAKDFGMVIPTPSKPTLDTMPREFFKELAVYTILEPMNIEKYKNFNIRLSNSGPGGGDQKGKETVKVI